MRLWVVAKGGASIPGGGATFGAAIPSSPLLFGVLGRQGDVIMARTCDWASFPPKKNGAPQKRPPRPMKNVLVTGGNKGIGLAICSGILRDHADIAILLGSRDASRGEEAVKGIIEKNPGAEGRVSMLLIDTSSDESVQAAAASFAASHGVSPPPLWAIVNNAGIVDSKSTDSMLQVNTMGPIRVNEAFAHLIQTDGGRIVNISSGAGPGFVGKLPKDLQPIFTDPAPTMEGTKNLIKSHFGTTTYGPGMTGYGLSKALVNVTPPPNSYKRAWILLSRLLSNCFFALTRAAAIYHLYPSAAGPIVQPPNLNPTLPTFTGVHKGARTDQSGYEDQRLHPRFHRHRLDKR